MTKRERAIRKRLAGLNRRRGLLLHYHATPKGDGSGSNIVKDARVRKALDEIHAESSRLWDSLFK